MASLSSRDQHAPVYTAAGLRLRSVTLHDVLKGLVLFCHLSHDINGTHEELVQMSVHHEVSAVH